MSKLEVKCEDTSQTIEKLPPPFIYYSGDSGDQKKKSTCLDYKARWEPPPWHRLMCRSFRYCCKSTEMYRPTKLDQMEMLIPPKCPLGPIFSTMAEVPLAVCSSTFPGPSLRYDQGVPSPRWEHRTGETEDEVISSPRAATLVSLSSFEEKRVTCTVQDGATTRTYHGTLKTIDKDMEGVGRIDRYVASLFPANSMQQSPKEKCTIKLDVSKEGQVGSSYNIL